jgi:small nuclear ribonucleoprotein (snRNP)-like protein
MDYRQYMHPYYMHVHHMNNLCKQHLHKQVKAYTMDGECYEGYVEHVDDVNVYLIVEVDVERTEGNENEDRNDQHEADEERGFGYGGYGYPGYGYGYPGYGYGYPGYYGHGYGYGGFKRLILPLAALTAISLL